MKLLINEFIKDYKKKTTWLYFLLSFGIILLNSYFAKRQFEDGVDAVKILSGITVVAAATATIFSLIMLANNLSQEYSKGTIKFLYTKPKSRSAILTAKIVLAFINYIIFLVVGTVFDFVTKNYVFFKNKVGLNHLNDTITEGYFGRTVAKQLIITNLADLTGLIQSLTIFAVSKFSWAKYHMFDVPLFSSYYSSEAGRQTVKEMFKFDNANALIIMLVAYSFVFFTISYIVNARRDITID